MSLKRIESCKKYLISVGMKVYKSRRTSRKSKRTSRTSRKSKRTSRTSRKSRRTSRTSRKSRRTSRTSRKSRRTSRTSRKSRRTSRTSRKSRRTNLLKDNLSEENINDVLSEEHINDVLSQVHPNLDISIKGISKVKDVLDPLVSKFDLGKYPSTNSRIKIVLKNIAKTIKEDMDEQAIPEIKNFINSKNKSEYNRNMFIEKILSDLLSLSGRFAYNDNKNTIDSTCISKAIDDKSGDLDFLK